jgi:hypothetical protein
MEEGAEEGLSSFLRRGREGGRRGREEGERGRGTD